MKLRSNHFFGIAASALLTLIALTGCGGASVGSAPPQSAPPRAWSPPTPFPPMVYPTEAPTPGLPQALQGRLPVSASTGQVDYAPVKGKMEQDLLEIEKDAAQVRGLEPIADVQEHFISKDQLQANMLSMSNKSYTREEARQQEIQLWLLRLVDEPNLDLYQLQANALSNEIVGYYDPAQKELFVLSGSDQLDPQAKATLAHEYVHSLQDQHFGLQKLLNINTNDTDRFLGAKSVVEGDATLSEILYADQYLSAKDFNKFVEDSLSYSAPASEVPDIFEAELHFPYDYGTNFVKQLYQRGGFPTVNKAFTDPPLSTEQIMHPEKYLAAQRDNPLPVGVPPLTDTLGAGWVYRYTESVGELELGVMLKDNNVQAKTAEAAAAGWGGGQVDLYENGANSLLVLGTRWDTQTDTDEFNQALRHSLDLVGRYGPDWSDGVRYFNIKRVGEKVFYVGATDPDALKRVLDTLK